MKSFFSDYGKYFFSLALPALCAFFATPFLAKALTTSQLGMLSVVWVFLSFSTNLDFGLSRLFSRVFTHREALDFNAFEIYFFSFLIQSFVSLIIGASFAFFVYLSVVVFHLFSVEVDFYLIFIYVLIGFWTSFIISLWRYLQEANSKVGLSAIVAGGVGCLVYLIPVFCIFFSIDFNVGLELQIVARFVVSLFLVFNFFLINYGGHSYSRFREFLTLVKGDGSWTILYSFFALLSSYADRLFLSIYFPSRIVAYYNIPVDFLGRLNLIPAVALRVTSASIDKSAHSNSVQLYERGLILAFLFSFFASFASLVVPWFMDRWLGSAANAMYGEVGSVFVLMVASSGFNYLFYNISVAVRLVNRSALIQISLFVFLIPALLFYSFKQSIVGIASVLVVRALFEAGLLYFFVFRRLRRKFFFDFLIASYIGLVLFFLIRR